MVFVTFQLAGDLALWRNPYEPVGSYSGLGPSPSHMAGLIGAAMGWAGPQSYASLVHTPAPEKTAKRPKGPQYPVWPMAEALLKWEQEQDYHLACAWTGGVPRRLPWNIKGFKDPEMGTLRLQQQVVSRPSYAVVVGVREPEAADELAARLRFPLFPMYLGSSAFRALVSDIRQTDAPENRLAPHGWAYRSDRLGLGEQVPFTVHRTRLPSAGERIAREGYWVYPTPLHAPPRNELPPWVKGYIEE